MRMDFRNIFDGMRQSDRMFVGDADMVHDFNVPWYRPTSDLLGNKWC